MNTLLQKLSNAVGVSGAEKEVRLLIKDEIADHVDEWRVDSMGNLIALKKGTGALDLRVMVDAHMDEVGMMITEVDAQGTAKFMNVGGMSGDILLGKVVQVGKKKMTGVIGAKPIHLLKTQAERTKTVTASNMRIDIGAASKEAGARKMKVGDCATFLTEYEEWGEVAVGKALDNRCGCVALIHLLRAEPYPFDLYAVFSVQEEIGLRGAPVAARGIDPDVAIILETTPAYDLPNKQDASPNVVLGGGASIYVMDRMAIQSPPLVRHIMKTATEHDIPFQVRQPGGGGTNTGVVQRSNAGTLSATIATPVRYAHTPHSMINLADFVAVQQLTEATLRSLSPDIFPK